MGRAKWYLGEWRWIRHLGRVMRNLVGWFAVLVLEFSMGVGNVWHVSNALLHANPQIKNDLFRLSNLQISQTLEECVTLAEMQITWN